MITHTCSNEVKAMKNDPEGKSKGLALLDHVKAGQPLGQRTAQAITDHLKRIGKQKRQETGEEWTFPLQAWRAARSREAKVEMALKLKNDREGAFFKIMEEERGNSNLTCSG